MRPPDPGESYSHSGLPVNVIPTNAEDVSPLLTLMSTVSPHTWDGFIETCFWNLNLPSALAPSTRVVATPVLVLQSPPPAPYSAEGQMR